MPTKNELIQQCKNDNPTIIQTINGVDVELTGVDYDKACKDWADMRLNQLKAEAETQAKVEAKEAAQNKLATLGLTVEDLTALGL